MMMQLNNYREQQQVILDIAIGPVELFDWFEDSIAWIQELETTDLQMSTDTSWELESLTIREKV